MTMKIRYGKENELWNITILAVMQQASDALEETSPLHEIFGRSAELCGLATRK